MNPTRLKTGALVKISQGHSTSRIQDYPEEAYVRPRVKIKTMAHFLCFVICNRHTVQTGIARIIRSVMVLKTPLELKSAATLTHFPWMDLFQIFSRGEHCQILMSEVGM